MADERRSVYCYEFQLLYFFVATLGAWRTVAHMHFLQIACIAVRRILLYNRSDSCFHLALLFPNYC